MEINRAELTRAMSVISRVAAERSTTPIIACVRVGGNKSDQTIALLATNFVIDLTIILPAQITEEFAFLVDAKRLYEWLSNLDSASITAKPDGTHILFSAKRESGRKTTCKMPTMPLNEFPAVSRAVDPLTVMEMPISEFLSAIRQVYFAAREGDSTSVLNACLFDIDVDRLTLVAGTQERLARRIIPLDNTSIRQFPIPKSSMEELDKLLSTQDPAQSVRLVVTGKNGRVTFETDSSQLSTLTIDAQYIAYEQIFDRFSSEGQVELHKSDLIRSIKTAAVFATDDRPLLNLRSGDGILSLSTLDDQTDLGRGEDEIPAQVTGDGLDRTFQYKLLAESVNAFASDVVTLAIGKTKIVNSDISLPLLMINDSSQGALQIAMPPISFGKEDNL